MTKSRLIKIFESMDISFVILNYKSKGLVKNCISSIIKADLIGLQYEIIVVDNNSEDGIKEMLQENFSEVIFIQSKYNLGMGAGNNLGIKNAKGKYIALLNPDTMVTTDSFIKMYNFMESNPKIGLAGPKLINPDGSEQYTRCRFPEFLIPIYRRTPLKKIPRIQKKIDHYLTKDEDYNKTTKTDWVYGACFFIRQEVLKKIGLFDERFFLGFEDTDLCRRVWQGGYEVYYYPESKIFHYPHRFSGERNWLFGFFKKNVREHIVSWLKYFWKYRSRNIAVRF